ncbi:MAG: ParB/RepB/Spo0J family partition protein [Clostridiaceae bacterium]|nr:ParB/RepB/Spo0J family partition protein [Clostridiaceae bacterium]
MSKKALGKGLNALFSEDPVDQENDIKEVDIYHIQPDKNQPRKNFDTETLNELAQSIKRSGVLQPILVREEKPNTYTIIAGERRWRAAKLAGLKTIPVIVKNLTDIEMIEVSLIENLQREDLNPIEEAKAYERLQKEFNKTQEEISEIVGKSRTAVTNSLRLLQLDNEIINLIEDSRISPGHARAILSLEDASKRKELAKIIIDQNLNVRQTEELAKKMNQVTVTTKSGSKTRLPEVIEIENKLQRQIGTKVKLNYNKGKGKIIIDFYSNEDLDRILELLQVE